MDYLDQKLTELGITPDPGKRWDDCMCSEIDPDDRPCIVCVAKMILIDRHPPGRNE